MSKRKSAKGARAIRRTRSARRTATRPVGEERPRLSINLEPALLERVRALAAKHDRSIAYVLRGLVWLGLRALEAGAPLGPPPD